MVLVDVCHQAASNYSTNFMLRARDVFTKYSFTVPLLSKIRSLVAEAADDIFDDQKLFKVCSNLSAKFKSAHFQEMLRSQGIKHFILVVVEHA